MRFIEVYFNGTLQDTIEINGDKLAIGRAAENQVHINNVGVSLQHAVISFHEKNWLIEDLNSTNGTYLNDVKIGGKQILKLGDTVNIGKYELKLVNSRTPVTPERHSPQSEIADRTMLVSSQHNKIPHIIPKVDNSYYIEVYFNSALQDTLQFAGDEVTIGRAAENQVQINNKAVSLQHAVINKTENTWLLTDLNSTNGTHLNGVKVAGRQNIKFGDTINFGKYDLKFLNTRTKVAPERHTAHTEEADGTILVSANRPNVHSNTPNISNCYLFVHGDSKNINKLLLTRNIYTVGKGKENDICIGGWFTPKRIAEIIRLGDSYYLAPLVQNKLKINGRPATSRIKLNNNDNITYKKLLLKFVDE